MLAFKSVVLLGCLYGLYEFSMCSYYLMPGGNIQDSGQIYGFCDCAAFVVFRVRLTISTEERCFKVGDELLWTGQNVYVIKKQNTSRITEITEEAWVVQLAWTRLSPRMMYTETALSVIKCQLENEQIKAWTQLNSQLKCSLQSFMEEGDLLGNHPVRAANHTDICHVTIQ